MREALIAVDLTPMIADVQFLSIPLRLKNNLQMPFLRDSTDYFPYVMLPKQDSVDYCNVDGTNFALAHYQMTGELTLPSLDDLGQVEKTCA